MAINANSYGTLAGTGALVPKWSGGGSDFADATRPTATQVEAWIDQVSSILNGILSQFGFAIPVSQADAVRALTMFVEEEVASIVNGINGSGRFGPTAKGKTAGGRFRLILEDVKGYVEGMAIGLERLGASRTYNAMAGLDFRDTDESGSETHPIFQRKAFGDSFTDWDSD